MRLPIDPEGGVGAPGCQHLAWIHRQRLVHRVERLRPLGVPLGDHPPAVDGGRVAVAGDDGAEAVRVRAVGEDVDGAGDLGHAVDIAMDSRSVGRDAEVRPDQQVHSGGVLGRLVDKLEPDAAVVGRVQWVGVVDLED